MRSTTPPWSALHGRDAPRLRRGGWLDWFPAYLKHLGIEVRVTIRDGAPLYPERIAQTFPAAEQAACTFHRKQEIWKARGRFLMNPETLKGREAQAHAAGRPLSHILLARLGRRIRRCS